MKTALLIAALAFLLPSQVFAERACTQMGCVDGLMLRSDYTREWKNGNYRFEFVLDNRHVTCYGELPLKPCGEPSIRCDKEGVMITESGCALPKNAHGFGDIHIQNDPRKVMVRITHNNKPILTKTIIRVEYLESRPNGPGCGPVCRSASYDLFDITND